jgi:hypothetical protein
MKAKSKSRIIHLPQKEIWPLRLLSAFSWFCDGENRKILATIKRDLKLDAKQMRKCKHSDFFINAVFVSRSIFGGIIPIAVGGVWRLVKPIKNLVKQ